MFKKKKIQRKARNTFSWRRLRRKNEEERKVGVGGMNVSHYHSFPWQEVQAAWCPASPSLPAWLAPCLPPTSPSPELALQGWSSERGRSCGRGTALALSLLARVSTAEPTSQMCVSHTHRSAQQNSLEPHFILSEDLVCRFFLFGMPGIQSYSTKCRSLSN